MEILLTVISISLLGAALAAVVVLADLKLNDYGICAIDINDGQRVLSVKGGSTLLASLSSQDIFIPSACGGKATCGLCKINVLTNVGPVLPTEEPYLTEDEIGEGTRLACQLKVKNDLRVFIPEELFSIRRYRAKILKITDLTYDIKEFRFELLEPQAMEFAPGQYVQVDSKPYDGVEEVVSRAYSISSLPSEKGVLELIVRLVPGGVCSTFLHKHVKEGDELTLSGPFGDFYLREGADELLFIAGGSGLAPIKSMVLDILKKGLPKRMTFFFGAVRKRDLYYVDFFTELQEKYPNFRYIPALSDPGPDDDWNGEIGLITEVVARHVSDGQNKHAYLCGSPGMINACVDVLTKIGIDEERIFYDKF